MLSLLAALTATLATALTAALATTLSVAFAATLAAAGRRSVILHLATADRRSILLHLAASSDFCAASQCRYRRAAANGGAALDVLARAFDRSAVPSAVAVTPLGRSVAPALPAIFAAPAEVAPPVASSAGFSPAPMLIDMASPLLELIASATAAAPTNSSFRTGSTRVPIHRNFRTTSSHEGCS